MNASHICQKTQEELKERRGNDAATAEKSEAEFRSFAITWLKPPTFREVRTKPSGETVNSMRRAPPNSVR